MRSIIKPLVFFGIPLSLLLSRPTQAEFVTLREDTKRSCSHQLSGAKNIAYQCQVITDSSNSLQVWQDRLSFQFGQLTEAEFNHLINTYGGWSKSKTEVTYNSDRNYQLIDFLPPIIQALDSHRFIPESTHLSNRDINVNSLPANIPKQLYLNCWGLVYEVLRIAQNSLAQPVIFMGQGSIMLDLLRTNSEQLIVIEEPEDDIPQSITKPGDIILIMHKSSTGHQYLDHVAIMIDDGIYFEKAGTGEEVPIRIIDEKTLRQIWQPGVFDYEVRRPIPDAIFPHAQRAFSLKSPKIQQEFAQLNKIPDSIAKNTTIMWEEEAKKLDTSSWFEIASPLPTYMDNLDKAKLTPILYKPLTKSLP